MYSFRKGPEVVTPAKYIMDTSGRQSPCHLFTNMRGGAFSY